MALPCLARADTEKMLIKNPGSVLRNFLLRRLTDPPLPLRLFFLSVKGEIKVDVDQSYIDRFLTPLLQNEPPHTAATTDQLCILAILLWDSWISPKVNSTNATG